MARGDLFLCSSEEQRLYYLGWLSALGRVNPLSVDKDPQLKNLIVEVHFGTPDAEVSAPPRRSEVLPGVDEDAPVLYFGGIYDWYDPETVLDAMPALLERDPRTVLVFVDHPHPDLTPQGVAGQIREKVKRRGWLGSTVRFESWRPFDQRFEFAQVADVAVVTHRPGLETDLSLRTRLVDLMWLGLPTVVSAGGGMAGVVEKTGAGTVVPAGDSGAVASAVREFLDDGVRRQHAAVAAWNWAAERRWSIVAAPLLEFAAKPWRDKHRERFLELAPGSVSGEEPLLQRLQRALRRKRGGR